MTGTEWNLPRVSSSGCLSTIAWASYQIRIIAGGACAGNAGYVYPAIAFKGNCQLAIAACSRHVRYARALMHVAIANRWWRGKRFLHSRRVRKPQFYVFCKRLVCAVCNYVSWMNISISHYISLSVFAQLISPDEARACVICWHVFLWILTCMQAITRRSGVLWLLQINDLSDN